MTPSSWPPGPTARTTTRSRIPSPPANWRAQSDLPKARTTRQRSQTLLASPLTPASTGKLSPQRVWRTSMTIEPKDLVAAVLGSRDELDPGLETELLEAVVRS